LRNEFITQVDALSLRAWLYPTNAGTFASRTIRKNQLRDLIVEIFGNADDLFAEPSGDHLEFGDLLISRVIDAR
jgi:hypothetical protein